MTRPMHVPTPRQPDCTNRATCKQAKYARNLGGDPNYCRSLSVGDAGEYIEWLKDSK